MTDIKSLLPQMMEAAGKATPGEWERGSGVVSNEAAWWVTAPVPSPSYPRTDIIRATHRRDDVAFIIAAQPQNILALCNAYIALEGERDALLASRDHAPTIGAALEWPLRYEPVELPNGDATTFAQMREAILKKDLPQHGDTILVWVNEGDLCFANMPTLSSATQVEGSWSREDLEAKLSALEEANERLARLGRAVEAERNHALERVEKAEGEVEQLRLAMLGGEDAPGYAMSLPLKTVIATHAEYARTVKDRAEAAEARLKVAEAVVEAAREMPRKTPAPGGCFTEHQFHISAGAVWSLDRALTEYDRSALSTLRQPEGESND